MKKILNLSQSQKGSDARINLKLRKIIKVITVSVMLMLLLAIFFISISKMFSLKYIEVVAEDIQLVVDHKMLSNNLLLIPIHKIEQQLLSEHAQLSNVKLKKKYPHTLVIEATVRDPIAQVSSSARNVLVDKEGIVIKEASENNQKLPILIFDESILFDGAKISNQQILSALSLINNLEGSVMVSTVKSFDESSFKVNTEGIEVIISNDSDTKLLADTLQTLVTRFRMKGTMPTQIDLRFNKPVVTY